LEVADEDVPVAFHEVPVLCTQVVLQQDDALLPFTP